MKNRIILAVALSIGLAASASAQILMTNPGFEEPNVATNDWGRWGAGSNTVGAFPGWTPIAGSYTPAIFVYGEDLGNMLKSPTSGDQSLSMASNTTTTQGLYQNLGTLQANTDYSFSYEIGFRPDTAAQLNYQIGLWGDTDDNGIPDTQLSVRTQANDSLTYPTTAGGFLAAFSSATVNSSTFNPDAIGNDFFFYIATTGTLASPNQELLVDNVGVIPEPGTALLFGAAGMFHLILRRRRRR
jgi:hypothetical protein